MSSTGQQDVTPPSSDLTVDFFTQFCEFAEKLANPPADTKADAADSPHSTSEQALKNIAQQLSAECKSHFEDSTALLARLPLKPQQLAYRLLIQHSMSLPEPDFEQATTNCQYLFASYGQNPISNDDLQQVYTVLLAFINKHPTENSGPILRDYFSHGFIPRDPIKKAAVAAHECLNAIRSFSIVSKCSARLSHDYPALCERFPLAAPLARFYFLCRHADLLDENGFTQAQDIGEEAVRILNKLKQDIHENARGKNKKKLPALYCFETMVAHEKLGIYKEKNNQPSTADFQIALENALYAFQHARFKIEKDRKKYEERSAICKESFFEMLIGILHYETFPEQDVMSKALACKELWVASDSTDPLVEDTLRRGAALLLPLGKLQKNVYQIISFLEQRRGRNVYAHVEDYIGFVELIIDNCDRRHADQEALKQAEEIKDRYYFHKERDKYNNALGELNNADDKSTKALVVLYETSKSKTTKAEIARRLMDFHYRYHSSGKHKPGNPCRYFLWLENLRELDDKARVNPNEVATMAKKSRWLGAFGSYVHWQYRYGLEPIPKGEDPKKFAEKVREWCNADLASARKEEDLKSSSTQSKTAENSTSNWDGDTKQDNTARLHMSHSSDHEPINPNLSVSSSGDITWDTERTDAKDDFQHSPESDEYMPAGGLHMSPSPTSALEHRYGNNRLSRSPSVDSTHADLNLTITTGSGYSPSRQNYG